MVYAELNHGVLFWGRIMKICKFVMPEIRILIDNCNFTQDELVLFNLRARDIPLEECAEIMNMSVSSVKRISQHVGWKIERVVKKFKIE